MTLLFLCILKLSKDRKRGVKCISSQFVGRCSLSILVRHICMHSRMHWILPNHKNTKSRRQMNRWNCHYTNHHSALNCHNLKDEIILYTNHLCIIAGVDFFILDKENSCYTSYGLINPKLYVKNNTK